MTLKTLSISLLLASGMILHAAAQEAPLGGPSSMTDKEKASLQKIKGAINGKIVWSTSRANSKHDIWIMNADGTDQKPLTASPNNVDWFSRFSPDGKTVLFARSKMGWVNEMDAEQFDKWDLWTIGVDGTNEKKVASDACWGTWWPHDTAIMFARGPKVFTKMLDSNGGEMEVFNAETFFKKKKVYAQQPGASPNTGLLCVTIRGTVRETGIYNFGTGEWNSTGAGCQIVFAPDGKSALRMNEGQGNGGTEILRFPVDPNGVPGVSFKGLSVPKAIRFMDLPGRRSHEYFPKLDAKTGTWLVWCATQTGHEHDIADYEVYLWNTGSDKKRDFVRLTFHTGNDRWPDIFIE